MNKTEALCSVELYEIYFWKVSLAIFLKLESACYLDIIDKDEIFICFCYKPLNNAWNAI